MKKTRTAGVAAGKPPRVLLLGGDAARTLEGTPDEMGFKACNLMRMAKIGLRVPPAFVLGTGYCRLYFLRKGRLPEGFSEQLRLSVHDLETITGAGFGNVRKPLLLSVRSGAAVSMPGMLDTILDVGLNDATVRGLIRATGNPRLAWDSYRRLVQSFGEIVCGLPGDPFEQALAEELRRVRADAVHELDFECLRGLAASYLGLFKEQAGMPFPQQPLEQLEQAVTAVFRSWTSDKAAEYRRLNRIDDALGTAVTVQAMVFGNSGGTSGAGVGFTRDPSSGERRLYMDFLFNAQGEDIVSGRHFAGDDGGLAGLMPEVQAEIEQVQRRLEQEFRDVQEFEFTVQDGKLWLLQTRTGKRTPLAQLRTTVEMVEEGLIEPAEALERLAGFDLDSIVESRLASDKAKSLLAHGVPAGLGVATGEIALDVGRAQERAAQGKPVILVRPDATTADIAGIAVAEGILTASGGRTSHAAVVARQLGKPCIVGCADLSLDESARRCVIGVTELKEGEIITLDGNTGSVHQGKAKVIEERPDKLLAAVKRWRRSIHEGKGGKHKSGAKSKAKSKAKSREKSRSAS
jgi:pyruvate,orthophosphate dikinase